MSGSRQLLFRDGYAQYTAATRIKDRGRDAYEHLWQRIVPGLGHLYVEEVDTSALDAFKQSLPKHLAPKSVNQHLILVRAVLRFLWKRSRLRSVPYVPMESVPQAHADWYTKEERDQLLEGMFRLEPQWYLFYYLLTMRLGLRTGEVYAGHRQIRREPQRLIVDQAVYIDSHVRPLKLVQRKLGLRPLSHHKVGRHSVASQAVTGGESIKAVQAQLGHRSEQSTHKYAHLGSGAQRRLIETLQPSRAPHERPSCESHGNLASTENERETAGSG